MKFKIFLYTILLGFISLSAWADNYPRNYNIDIIHYNFKIQLSDKTDEIVGTTKVNLVFKKENIKDFRLDLVNIDKNSIQKKGMQVESVLYNGVPVNFTHQDNSLHIQWNNGSQKEQVVEFTIQYKGIPAGGLRIGLNKYGERCFFNENWPNNTRHWLPTIDHPYDKATNEFIVIAPSKYKVVSNGLLMEESKLDAENNLTHWKQNVPVSSWLYVLGVAEFAVQHVDEFDHKSIQTWVYPKDREAGFRDFETPTKEVLAFYTAYVGPFAYEKLANIQSPSVSGGMETSSAILYAENLVDGKKSERLRNVVIHEIAHQWFGNAITETTWDDAWLSEGFATYFTLLFQEYQYGSDEYINGLVKARKSVFDYTKKDPTFSIIDNRTAETGPVTSGITYQKGAWVLHMLRDRMGNENFKKGIQAYYKKYFNSNTTTEEFIATMQAYSKEELTSYLNQWLRNPYVLKIDGYWKYDSKNKQVVIDLTQDQSNNFIFNTPIEFSIYNQNNQSYKLVKLEIDSKNKVFKIPFDQIPTHIVADPRTVLLADINFSKN
ncbi:MAG: hypothetical protein RL387_1299 [Bacteroidota bacterium]|jgi:aminopeptidase N